jgi:hypothetical protein
MLKIAGDYDRLAERADCAWPRILPVTRSSRQLVGEHFALPAVSLIPGRRANAKSAFYFSKSLVRDPSTQAR